MRVVSLRSKICEKSRENLDAYISGELLIETNQDVLQHLENCTVCCDSVLVRLRLKDRLKQTVSATPVPSDLRDRLETAIRRQASSRQGRAVWPHWSLAAAVLLVLGLTVSALRLVNLRSPSAEITLATRDLTVSEQAAALLKIGISDHIHCVMESRSDEEFLTSEQIAQEMGPHYQGLIPAVRKELPEGFFISTGHRCAVGEREFVHMVLKHGDAIVSVAITENTGPGFPAGDSNVSSVEAAGIALHRDQLQSLQAIGFQAKGHLAFVVSSLGHEENLQIAARLAPPVSRFLEHL